MLRSENIRPPQEFLASVVKAPALDPQKNYPSIPDRSSFDVEVMGDRLDAPNNELLRRLRTLLASETFARPDPAISVADYRTLVLRWCCELARHGFGGLVFPAAYGGGDDRGGFMAVAELLAQHDGSMMVKFGVHFGLWGGSVLLLGTENHHRRYLPDTIRLTRPGCFAMTEVGHGSNVRDLETTATYDATTNEFVIHTPSPGARKAYIGNAAAHARVASVFAQLEIGGVRHGVHPFVVPIRDEQGCPLPGVTIDDQGAKLGLNAVDNGRIWFDHVRIPRGDMLDRFAQVAPDGTYTSAITNPDARFFTMLGTLVGGRISVGLGGLGMMKTGLAIAVRYGARRRQFGLPGQPETRLLDYPVHQRRLLPRLASAYAIHFALRDLASCFVQASSEADTREVETLAAGVKAWATAYTMETLQVAREACGGEGYLAINRFAALKADADIFTTFEGDNTVLLQLVAKNLLSGLRRRLATPLGKLRLLRGQVSLWASWRSPWARRRCSREQLTSIEWQEAVLSGRAQMTLLELGRAVQAGRARGLTTVDAFVACQPAALVAAEATVEHEIYKRFVAAVAATPGATERRILDQLRAAFGLTLMERRLGWLATRGFVGSKQALRLDEALGATLAELRPEAVGLVDAWRISLGAPIAS